MTASRRRVGLGVVDQTLSSASNMLAVFAVAGVSTVPQFGAITLAIAGVMAMVALCRGLLGTPIAMLSGRHAQIQAETEHAVAVAGMLGVLVGILVAGCAPFAADPWSVVLVGAAAPAILIQDTARFACIADGRPGLAVISDGFWAAGSALLFVLAGWVIPGVSPRWIVGGWAVLAVLAALIISLCSRFKPVFGGTAAWLRSTAPDRARFGATSAISAINSILFLFVVAGLVGSSAIAALRGSASVMGPLAILLTAMTLVVLPEFRRMPGATPAEYWRPMRKVASVLCVIPVCAGVLSAFVPGSWGETLLGPTWFVAKPLLPITAVEFVALTWSFSADAILRAQANSRAVLTVQVVHSVLITGGAAVGALLGGTALAVAIGLAVGGSIAAGYGVIRTLHRLPPRPPSSSASRTIARPHD